MLRHPLFLCPALGLDKSGQSVDLVDRVVDGVDPVGSVLAQALYNVHEVHNVHKKTLIASSFHCGLS